MHISVTARDLEPLYASTYYSAASGVSLVGSSSERVACLCDWLVLEMDAADLRDHDTIQALKRLVTKVDKSLKASDIPEAQ